MRAYIAALLLTLIISGFLAFVISIDNNPTSACVIITDGWGHGSGVHIGDGVILTAGHVASIEWTWVEDSTGRTYDVIDRWVDPFCEDIGFVVIRNKDMPSLKLGNMPEVGDIATIIGNPLDLALSFNVTKGIVSNLYVNIDGWWYDALIVDAAAWLGNSGSPVLNSNNEIIGVLVGGYGGYDSMSICEPVCNIRWSLELFLESR